jgi:hypothetical protein
MITTITSNNLCYNINDSILTIYNKNNNSKKFKFDCTNISNTEILLSIPFNSGNIITVPTTAPSNNTVCLYNNIPQWNYLPSVQCFVQGIGKNITTTGTEVPITCDIIKYNINQTGNTGGWTNNNTFKIPVSGIYSFNAIS